MKPVGWASLLGLAVVVVFLLSIRLGSVDLTTAEQTLTTLLPPNASTTRVRIQNNGSVDVYLWHGSDPTTNSDGYNIATGDSITLSASGTDLGNWKLSAADGTGQVVLLEEGVT